MKKLLSITIAVIIIGGIYFYLQPQEDPANSNLAALVTSEETCIELFGEALGDSICGDESERKKLKDQLEKLRDKEIKSTEEWQNFNPLRLSMGFRNTNFIDLEDKNGVAYFASGSRGPVGDAPFTGGYYHLIAIYFNDNNNVSIKTDYVGDFVYYGSIFNKDEQKIILERLGEIGSESDLDKRRSTTFTQLNANIDGRTIEGTFTEEEQQTIIEYINNFKNSL